MARLETVIPDEWLPVLSDAEQQTGQTRSELVRAGLRRVLPRELRERLTEPRGRGQKITTIQEQTK